MTSVITNWDVLSSTRYALQNLYSERIGSDVHLGRESARGRDMEGGAIHGGCLVSRRWSSMDLRSTTQRHKVSKTAVGRSSWPSTTITLEFPEAGIVKVIIIPRFLGLMGDVGLQGARMAA